MGKNIGTVKSDMSSKRATLVAFFPLWTLLNWVQSIWKASVILTMVIFPFQAIAGSSTPDDVAHEFYAWVLSQPGAGSGLPTHGEKKRLAEFFSPALLQLLGDAIAMERKCIETNIPGDKPHIVEGNIFVGNYEGATEVVVGESRTGKKDVTVESRLFSIDPRFPKSHRHRVIAWTDQLVINRDGNRWVISNIKYGSGNSLSSFLDEYLEYGAKWCKTPKAM